MIEQKVKRRSVTRSLTRYVVFCIAMIIVYTITVMVLQCFSIVIPEELTVGWYSFFGGETFLCAVIKWLKLKKEE